MSGKPSTLNVNKLLWAVHRYEEAERESQALLIEVANKEAELKKLGDELQSQQKEIWDLMEQMDLAAPGNYGHQGRMTWFLAELFRQMTGKEVNGISLREESTKWKT